MKFTSDADSQAARLLREAIALCRHCHGFWRDERLWGDGHDLDYAVDTDVLVMYSAPLSHGAHAQSFSGRDPAADQRLAGLLARCLLDYIFLRFVPGGQARNFESVALASGASFALLPPHDREWSRVATAIAGESADEAQSAAELVDSLPGLDALFQAQIGVAGVSSYLSDNAAEVMRVLDSLSPASAQVTRLNDLPAQKIMRLRQHPSFGRAHADRIPPGLKSDSSEFLELERMAERWYSNMLPLRAGTKLENIEGDAWALARLEWINAHAAAHQPKRRMLLVTATDRLFQVGANVVAPHDPTQSFAQAYLRHPLAFLGAQDFFVNDQFQKDDAFRLRAWLAVLFPNVVKERLVVPESDRAHASHIEVSLDEDGLARILKGDTDLIDRALTELAKRGYREQYGSSFPENALHEWSQVVSGAAINQDLKLSVTERSGRWSDLFHRLAGARDAATLKGLLKEELGLRIQNSFLALYNSIGFVGTVQALGDGQHVRGLPALRFDVVQEQDAYRKYEDLCSSLWDARPEEFDIASLYASLSRSDSSNYRATVIHAFVCASSDLWFQTRTLCRIALGIVGQLEPSTRGNRTGREAAYILAVALRRLANSVAGLDEAEASLDDAIERAVGEEKDDVRFSSERLALKVARRQFARYFDKVAVPSAAAQSAPHAAQITETLEVIAEAEQICQRVSPKRDPSSVQSWVTRQAVTNAAIAAILSYAAGLRSPQIVGSLRPLLARLDSQRLCPALVQESAAPAVWRDDISDFVYLVATAIFDGDDRRRQAARAQLSTRLQQTSEATSLPNRQRTALAYESQRRTEFLRLAGIE